MDGREARFRTVIHCLKDENFPCFVIEKHYQNYQNPLVST